MNMSWRAGAIIMLLGDKVYVRVRVRVCTPNAQLAGERAQTPKTTLCAYVVTFASVHIQ
jgi:hypothetical protein